MNDKQTITIVLIDDQAIVFDGMARAEGVGALLLDGWELRDVVAAPDQSAFDGAVLLGRRATGGDEDQEHGPGRLAEQRGGVGDHRRAARRDRLVHVVGGRVLRPVDQLQGLADALIRRSGVPWDVWEKAGQEMLEAVMPLQSGNVSELFGEQGDGPEDRDRARESARRLGLGSVTLATDFPITTATFGYSRADYQPDACRLNPFPAERDHGGKFPIFVDVVQADAILLRLDHDSVLRWMSANGFVPLLPRGEDPRVGARAYFVNRLDGVSLRQTIQAPEARLVFGLLHTLSHLAVRRASLLCGLEGTSLSEYVLPRTLTCAIYCNHRFGATIGALSALFEQSLVEWLAEIRSSRRCVYDPVCIERGGSCHACSHLAETSCRFFNLNLGRPFLFGGRDSVLGEIRTGFLDFVVGR